MHNIEFQRYLIITLLVIAYVIAGMYSWVELSSHATTAEELEFVASPSASPWSRLGQGVMILTWPLWTVGASIAFKLVRLFRREAAAFAAIPE